MNTLLELLEQDCTQSPAQLAAQAGMTEAEAKDELRRLEASGLSGTRKQFLCGHPFRLLVVLRL